MNAQAHTARIEIVVDHAPWRAARIGLRRLRDAALRAIERGQRGKNKDGSLTLLLASDARLRELNARFRGKDSPTNVLAFPAGPNPAGYLGDVAMALGVARREAAAAGIPLASHVQHLAVHGVLHLLGYDHVTDAQARVMEPLEIAVLKELAIPNPYLRAGHATRMRQA